MPRKPLDPNCNASITCPVEGHTTSVRSGITTRFGHIPLTPGQKKTFRERSRAQWEAEKASRAAQDQAAVRVSAIPEMAQTDLRGEN